MKIIEYLNKEIPSPRIVNLWVIGYFCIVFNIFNIDRNGEVFILWIVWGLLYYLFLLR